MTLTTRKFGSYEPLYELKSGGMGAVLLARRRGPGAFEQLVAVKTIRAEFANATAVRAMFLDEAAILARVSHPGVANVHDFGEQDGTLYMVMEYVAGIPFRELMDMRPPPTVVARAIAEACRGLHAAHELRDLQGNVQGLVHRDISPDNLMLGFDGHVKVIDFGIALVKNRQAPVTEFGTVKGKPPYMSPEQVKNEPIDRRSDVFSLGVVMWELLTGEHLFDGDSLFAIAYAVDSKEIVPPSTITGRLPTGLDAVVLGALDRKLDARTATAALLAEQLEAVVQQAGEETLEAWADRELRVQREAHRTWLAGIVGGLDLPKAVGRPSGSVTQLAPNADQPPAPLALAATPVNEPAKGPAVATHVMPDDNLSIPPRRRLGTAIGAAVLLLVLVGLVLMLVRPHGDATVPDARLADARPIDTRTADAVVRIDAALDAPADAAVTLDAAVRVTMHPDARVAPKPDAAVPKPIDAAVEPALTGTGSVTLLPVNDKEFANVSIDGGPGQPTPIFGLKLPAGKHAFSFVGPTGKPLYARSITLHDGERVTVQVPAGAPN